MVTFCIFAVEAVDDSSGRLCGMEASSGETELATGTSVADTAALSPEGVFSAVGKGDAETAAGVVLTLAEGSVVGVTAAILLLHPQVNESSNAKTIKTAAALLRLYLSIFNLFGYFNRFLTCLKEFSFIIVYRTMLNQV
jgi:hypothetical protein